ncbi:MAG: rhomboid family intramembrane serine protease [Ignavibacteriae bacterium]|nr:rhomboid family intramembrane serine protease [Ignavibacteriota bacterium]
MEDDKARIKIGLFIASVFLLVIWLVKIFEVYTGIDLTEYGVFPHQAKGLRGILFSPFIHSDFTHLISNSTSLFILTFSLFALYTRSSLWVFPIVYIFHGLAVWLFAREAYHIGASGLVYGFASYLFFIGVFRKDSRSIALSLLVVFLYGGLVWGVLPTDPGVSFEAHLAGGVIGLMCSVIFRKYDPLPPKPEEEDEEDEDIEINYDYNGEVNPDDVKIKEDAQPVWFVNTNYKKRKNKN